MDDDLLKRFPELVGIDPKKLAFIQEFAALEKPKNAKEALPFLLSAMSRAKKNNIQFSNSEIALISELLMTKMQPAEQARAKNMLAFINRSNP